jgi:hypothetical protein
MGNLCLTSYVTNHSNLSQFLDNNKKPKSLGRLKTHLNGTVKGLCENDRTFNESNKQWDKNYKQKLYKQDSLEDENYNDIENCKNH